MANNKETLFHKLVSEKTAADDPKENLLRFSYKLRIPIIVATILACTFFFTMHFSQKLYETPDYTIVPGYIWQSQTLKAEFSFPIYKQPADFIEEKNKAKDKAITCFTLDKNAQEEAYRKIEFIIDGLSYIAKGVESPDLNLNEKALAQFELTPANQKAREIEKLNRDIKSFLAEIFDYGFVDYSLDKISKPVITVYIPPNREVVLKKIGLTDKNTFTEKASKFVAAKFPLVSQALAFDIISKFNSPNLFYSFELTEQSKGLLEKSVPRTMGMVRKGETIIEKGDKVTPEHIAKIQSYQSSMFMKSDNYYSWTYYIGSFGHAALIYLILLLYLIFIRKRILNDNFQLAMLSLIMVLVSLASWASIQLPSSFPLEFLVIIPAFSMLIAIVFDSRTAFYSTVTMALLLAGIRGNDYTTGTSMMFAGILASYTVRDIQNRTQMFQSIFFIFIGFLFPVIVFGLERSSEIDLIIKKIGLSAINSAISPLITFGLLFILERVSNIATDLRIKEYDNLNHPLLVKMSESAPGTYQHTLSVALLSERCAQAIGANPLIAKVGAYFHDIGKIAKSEYFTENQIDFGNKHDLLSPKKSASAIRQHIIDGLDLAKQYKLPQRIVDFIPMHHGTTLIKHFYAKALEEAPNFNLVKEEDFRYPGPKPNSKETAILMICDSAEAISRVETINKDEIEDMIDKNIKERILDGQFDDSDITMNDLHRIKETIVRNLIGKTHKRPKYSEIPPKQ